MSSSLAGAIEEIARSAAVQLDRLLDGTSRPEVSLSGLSRSCLELLLRDLVHICARLQLDPALSNETKELLGSIVARYEAYERATVDVRQHLGALSAGWSCSGCSKQAVSSAFVTGVRAGVLRVELVCKACGKTTPVSEAGRATFDQVFGALVSAGWNPLANGFDWDER